METRTDQENAAVERERHVPFRWAVVVVGLAVAFFAIMGIWAAYSLYTGQTPLPEEAGQTGRVTWPTDMQFEKRDQGEPAESGASRE